MSVLGRKRTNCSVARVRTRAWRPLAARSIVTVFDNGGGRVAKTNVDKLTAGLFRVSEIINNIFHFLSPSRRMLGIFNIAEA